MWDSVPAALANKYLEGAAKQVGCRAIPQGWSLLPWQKNSCLSALPVFPAGGCNIKPIWRCARKGLLWHGDAGNSSFLLQPCLFHISDGRSSGCAEDHWTRECLVWWCATETGNQRAAQIIVASLEAQTCCYLVEENTGLPAVFSGVSSPPHIRMLFSQPPHIRMLFSQFEKTTFWENNILIWGGDETPENTSAPSGMPSLHALSLLKRAQLPNRSCARERNTPFT